MSSTAMHSVVGFAAGCNWQVVSTVLSFPPMQHMAISLAPVLQATSPSCRSAHIQPAAAKQQHCRPPQQHVCHNPCCARQACLHALMMMRSARGPSLACSTSPSCGNSVLVCRGVDMCCTSSTADCMTKKRHVVMLHTSSSSGLSAWCST